MRLGRTLQRKQARLVILDEPFRGVDSLEVRRARKALAPITSSSAFYSKMATTRRISLPLPYPEPSPSVVLAKPTRLWWNAKSGRGRLNHDVAIVERRSFDRAKTNLVEQDAVLGDAALRSIHCEHRECVRKSGSRSLSTNCGYQQRNTSSSSLFKTLVREHKLDTCETTLKIHRGHVMRKMRSGSLTDLVHMAERWGDV